VDVRAAARLALPHRRRRQPFDAPQLDEEELDRALAGAGEDPEDDPDPGDDGPGGGGRRTGAGAERGGG
jgi:magnesium chelatase subunit D